MYRPFCCRSDRSVREALGLAGDNLAGLKVTRYIAEHVARGAYCLPGEHGARARRGHRRAGRARPPALLSIAGQKPYSGAPCPGPGGFSAGLLGVTHPDLRRRPGARHSGFRSMPPSSRNRPMIEGRDDKPMAAPETRIPGGRE